MDLTTIVTLLGEIGVLIGAITPVVVTVGKYQTAQNVNCAVRCCVYIIITAKAERYGSMSMKTLCIFMRRIRRLKATLL